MLPITTTAVWMGMEYQVPFCQVREGEGAYTDRAILLPQVSHKLGGAKEVDRQFLETLMLNQFSVFSTVRS